MGLKNKNELERKKNEKLSNLKEEKIKIVLHVKSVNELLLKKKQKQKKLKTERKIKLHKTNRLERSVHNFVKSADSKEKNIGKIQNKILLILKMIMLNFFVK